MKKPLPPASAARGGRGGGSGRGGSGRRGGGRGRGGGGVLRLGVLEKYVPRADGGVRKGFRGRKRYMAPQRTHLSANELRKRRKVLNDARTVQKYRKMIGRERKATGTDRMSGLVGGDGRTEEEEEEGEGEEEGDEEEEEEVVGEDREEENEEEEEGSQDDVSSDEEEEEEAGLEDQVVCGLGMGSKREEAAQEWERGGVGKGRGRGRGLGGGRGGERAVAGGSVRGVEGGRRGGEGVRQRPLNRLERIWKKREEEAARQAAEREAKWREMEEGRRKREEVERRRRELRGQMRKRTKSGQVVMKVRMEHLLESIQRNQQK